MTTPDDDPFAEDPITRDQYGRARIIPIKRGKPDLKAKLVGYTRVSTFADAIADAGGLATWRLWHLALGLGRNPDLAALAGVFGPTVDDLSRADKQALNEIIERAHDRSGGNVKADYGTVVHAYTEPGAQTVPDPFDNPASMELAHAELAARITRDTAAYHATMQAYGLETVDTEQFVVNDEVQSAGTYDHQVRLSRDLVFTSGGNTVTLPAGTVPVLDKKTGKLHFDSQCIQLAVYANAKRYNPETGERSDLGASTDYGILAHIPNGEARCDLYLIDLRIGWAAAKLALKVREHRTRKDIAQPFPAIEPSEPVTPAVSVLDTVKVGYIVPMTEEAIEHHVAAVEPVAAALTAEVIRELADVVAPVAEPTDEQALATVTDILGGTVVPSVVEQLAKAKDRDALSAIWRANKADWSEDHTTALRARAAQLEEAA